MPPSPLYLPSCSSDSRATRSLAADRSLTPPVLPVVVVDVVVEALVVGWLLVVASLLLALWYLRRLYKEMFATYA